MDTDHLSILQRQTGQDYINLSTRMAHYSLAYFAVSTVTFHEQILGSHTYINRARNLDDMVKGLAIASQNLGQCCTILVKILVPSSKAYLRLGNTTGLIG